MYFSLHRHRVYYFPRVLSKIYSAKIQFHQKPYTPVSSKQATATTTPKRKYPLYTATPTRGWVMAPARKFALSRLCAFIARSRVSNPTRHLTRFPARRQINRRLQRTKFPFSLSSALSAIARDCVYLPFHLLPRRCGRWGPQPPPRATPWHGNVCAQARGRGSVWCALVSRVIWSWGLYYRYTCMVCLEMGWNVEEISWNKDEIYFLETRYGHAR